MTSIRPRSLSRVLFLALVAVLPLHTVFIRAEIAWKPWLILLILLAVVDLRTASGFPWHRRASLGVIVFLVAVLVSWPGSEAGPTFWRLWLALGAGGLLLLTTARHASRGEDLLKVVFWSSAALGFTAVVLGLVTNGVFGAEASSGINDLLLIERVNKPAYLSTGFVALTNWHQDPGYSALWTNVWLVLSVFAWSKGLIRGPRWVGPVVIGGLIAATILTFSRTGWIGLIAAVGVLLLVHWKRERKEFGAVLRLLAYGAGVGVLLVGLQIVADPPGVGGDVLIAMEFRFTQLAELASGDLGEVVSTDPNLVVPDNRVDVWRAYGQRFIDHPVRGIGLGTGWSEPGLQEPHNLWLQLAAESGVIGTLGFLFMLATIGGRGGLVAGGALGVVAVATLTQTVLFEPVLWFGLGLWVAATKATSEPKAPKPVLKTDSRS